MKLISFQLETWCTVKPQHLLPFNMGATTHYFCCCSVRRKIYNFCNPATAIPFLVLFLLPQKSHLFCNWKFSSIKNWEYMTALNKDLPKITSLSSLQARKTFSEKVSEASSECNMQLAPGACRSHEVWWLHSATGSTFSFVQRLTKWLS